MMKVKPAVKIIWTIFDKRYISEMKTSLAFPYKAIFQSFFDAACTFDIGIKTPGF